MTRTLTRQQDEIASGARHLLSILDAKIPANVSHYALDGARNALVILQREAHQIHTHDFAGAWQDGDVATSTTPDGKVRVTYVRQDGQWQAFGRETVKSFRATDADVDRWLGGSLGSEQVYHAVIRAGKPVA